MMLFNTNFNNNEDKTERIEDVFFMKSCDRKMEKQNNMNIAPKLRPNEKAFLSSFIDPSITVGYRYKVRRNGSSEFLFGGKSLYLETINRDYNTELTFEDQNVCSVKNSTHCCGGRFGYALSIDVLEQGMIFKVYEEDEKVGTCVITGVNGEQQILSSQKGMKPNFIDFKEVQGNFKCQLNLKNKSMDSDVAGIISTMKRPGEKYIIKRIEALIFPLGNMLKLLP